MPQAPTKRTDRTCAFSTGNECWQPQRLRSKWIGHHGTRKKTRVDQSSIAIPLGERVRDDVMSRNPLDEGLRLTFHQCLLQHSQVDLDLPVCRLWLIRENIKASLGVHHQIVRPLASPQFPLLQAEVLVKKLRQSCSHEITVLKRRGGHTHLGAHAAPHNPLDLHAGRFHDANLRLALQNGGISQAHHNSSLAMASWLSSIGGIAGWNHHEVAPVIQLAHHLDLLLFGSVDHLVQPFQSFAAQLRSGLLHVWNSIGEVVATLTTHPVELPDPWCHLAVLLLRDGIVGGLADDHLLQILRIVIHGVLKLQRVDILPLPPSTELRPSIRRFAKLAKSQSTVDFIPNLLGSMVPSIAGVIHMDACYRTQGAIIMEGCKHPREERELIHATHLQNVAVLQVPQSWAFW